MNKKERDTFEELFHAKLYNHEVDTTPGDWEQIMNRLPESKPVSRTLNRRWWYGAAAAIAALTVTTGILFMADEQQPEPGISHQIEIPIHPQPEEKQPTTVVPEVSTETTPVLAAVTPTPKRGSDTPAGRNQAVTTRSADIPESVSPTTGQEPVVIDNNPVEDKADEPVLIKTPATGPHSTLIVDPEPTRTTSETKKTRRWGLGMGGGSLTASADNTFNTLVQHTASYDEDRQLLMMNTAAKSTDHETNIRYKTPVSFGLSASYALTDRWSLMAGLTYSMLVSEFDQTAKYHNEVRRKLHFVGLPISAAYNIAEWNSFRLYAAAGFMPELNVAGKDRIRRVVDDEIQQTTHEDVRIKKLFWSVNGRVGVSYPVVRYVNAFAEVGASYYFDNGVDIKTIHSEKPFNVAFNFGLRLGF